MSASVIEFQLSCLVNVSLLDIHVGGATLRLLRVGDCTCFVIQSTYERIRIPGVGSGIYAYTLSIDATAYY